MAGKRKFPSYRLHKSSGQAVVTLNGHDRYLGKYDSPESHAEYDRLNMEWLAAGRAEPAPKAKDVTISEVLKAYISWSEVNNAGKLDHIKRSVGPAVKLYGKTAAAEFGPSRLKAVRAAMVESGWNRRTVNQRVQAIVRAFKWGVEEELVPAMVYHALKAVEGLRQGRTAAPEPKKIPPAPAAAIAAAKTRLSPFLCDVIDVQLLTASRPGEILGMRAEDLDRSGPVWFLRPGKHKTAWRGKSKLIFIGPQCQEILKRRFRPDHPTGNYYLFASHVEAEERRRLYRAKRTTPISPAREQKREANRKPVVEKRYRPTSYANAVSRACERAGCEHWHPNQLRHSAATMLRAEFGIEVARLVLGHSHVSTTEIYAEEEIAKAVAAILKIG